MNACILMFFSGLPFLWQFTCFRFSSSLSAYPTEELPAHIFIPFAFLNAPWLLRRRKCYLLPQNQNRLLCRFAWATWVPFSILSSWVLDLVAPCNPVMEPHLKARWIPQRTISLKQSHYQCLSMCDWQSNAIGRSSASARGHQGEVLPSTLTSGDSSLLAGPQSPYFFSVIYVWLPLASLSAVIRADVIIWLVVGLLVINAYQSGNRLKHVMHPTAPHVSALCVPPPSWIHC